MIHNTCGSDQHATVELPQHLSIAPVEYQVHRLTLPDFVGRPVKDHGGDAGAVNHEPSAISALIALRPSRHIRRKDVDVPQRIVHPSQGLTRSTNGQAIHNSHRFIEAPTIIMKHPQTVRFNRPPCFRGSSKGRASPAQSYR